MDSFLCNTFSLKNFLLAYCGQYSTMCEGYNSEASRTIGVVKITWRVWIRTLANIKFIFTAFSLVSHHVIHYISFAGASSGAIDLLPSPSATTNWTAGLLMDNNDMIFKFDGKQGAKIPDGIVPKNLTDQFTITLWMKHGPSPGLRAEKETILCNSDKTGQSVYWKIVRQRP